VLANFTGVTNAVIGGILVSRDSVDVNNFTSLEGGAGVLASSVELYGTVVWPVSGWIPERGGRFTPPDAGSNTMVTGTLVTVTVVLLHAASQAKEAISKQHSAILGRITL
jgi:hypothetical protein